MWKNYLVVALRNLRKHPGNTFINVAGLAAGIAGCLLILLYVQDERSFDAFHTRADRIYRVCKVVTPQTGPTERHAITSGRMGPAMAADFPEVATYVRILPWFDDVLMSRGTTTLNVANVLIADAAFFEVFDFRLLRGDPARVLAEPMSIVLTEETAHRIFGDRDPIGQVVTGLEDLAYTVTGIAAAPPANSHLTYDALISWSSTEPGVGPLNMAWLNNWITQVHFTYLLLAPGAAPAALEEKLPAFMARHFPERADQYHLYLQPLRDIHLQSAGLLFQDKLRLGNAAYVYLFSGAAVFILAIACINFMNLATARAAKRAREVGVRKVLGASRPALARQFLGESMLMVALALVAAVALVELARPVFNAFTGKDLGFDPAANPSLLAALAGIGLATGLAAGGYPALLLSGLRPVQVLRGAGAGPGGGARLRRVLVTVQFAASIVLLAGTAVVYLQMRYVQNRDLGFDRGHVVVLPIEETAISERLDAFKQEVLQHPSVTHAAGSQQVPGGGTMSFGLRPEGKPETETWTAQAIRVDDDDLLETYGLEMTTGRYFSEAHPTDTAGVVINEALARSLGWDDPVGKRLDLPGELEQGTVIGVVRDFHVESLHQPIAPLVIYRAGLHPNLSLRISGENIPAVLDFLRAKWTAFEDRHPFTFTFVDEAFDRFYRAERRLMQTLGLFAAFAVAIACLGLFGLAALTAEQRTKEIGIRKVLGASVGGVVVLLSGSFARLALAALAGAAPVVYFGAYRWLNTFAYHIPALHTVGALVAAGLVVLAVALLTVSYQAVRAALADPVDALRYE